MYIPDEVVLQLYDTLGKIPTKYGAAPYVILSRVIANNEKSKTAEAEGEKENVNDVSTVSK